MPSYYQPIFSKQTRQQPMCYVNYKVYNSQRVARRIEWEASDRTRDSEDMYYGYQKES